jgi:hypothetical protein
MTTDDPDTQRQALQRLGYDVPEEVEDVEPAEYEDPYDELRAEINELRQWRDQNQTQAQQAQAFEFLNGHIASEVERLGMAELDDDTRQLVLAQALAAPGVPAPPGAPTTSSPTSKRLESLPGVENRGAEAVGVDQAACPVRASRRASRQ